MRGIFRSLLSFLLVIGGNLCALPVLADDLSDAQQLIKSVETTGVENVSPEIRTAYEKLKKSVDSIDTLTKEYKEDLQENADAMKEKEQSTANKLIGGISMGAAGIGGMQLMSGLAEQSADSAAQQDMNAYLATFKCDYGAGLNINGGSTDIILPTSLTLMQLRTEYIQLADRVKDYKAALDLAPGIEANEILDISETNLYDNDAIGKTTNALDTVADRVASSDSADKVKTGAIVAGTGLVGGAVANLIVNKDAPKERSEQITHEYEAQYEELSDEVQNDSAALQTAIDENQRKIDEYNKLLALHKEFVASITEPDCIPDFAEYIEYINGLQPITDSLTDTSNLTIKYDLETQKAAYAKCVEAAELERKRQECISKPNFEWIDNQCVEKAPEITPETEVPTNENDEDTPVVVTPPATEDEQPQPETDPNLCPDVNPRFQSAKGKRIGDSCTYGNVTKGHIFKYEAGTMRNGVDVGGTCSCSADECATGYKLSGGMCTECADGYEKNQDGKCVKTATVTALEKCPFAEYDWTNENNTVEKCIKFCNERAETENCKYYGAAVREVDKKCICSSSLPNNSKIVKFYAVCDYDKGKSGGTEYCIDDIFTNKVYGGTQVHLAAATALAKEYIRLNYNDESIVCSDDTRPCGLADNDDCLQCSSKDKNDFYEFIFDDIKEHKDNVILDSLLTAICKLHNTRYIYRTKDEGGYTTRWSTCDTNDSTVCAKINETANLFGYSAEIGKNRTSTYSTRTGNSPCVLYQTTEITYDNLRTAYDLDNARFRNFKMLMDTNLEAQLRDYVKRQMDQMGYALTSFECEKTYHSIMNYSGLIENIDDVLTCYVNDRPVDFIFDSLSASAKYNQRAAQQGMQCIISGGTYSGKDCTNLTSEQCMALATANLQNCPECATAYWDGEACVLPDASKATNIQKGLKLGAAVGAMAAGVVITITTAGTGTGAAIVIVLEATGAVVTTVAEAKMQTVAQDFLRTSQNCEEASCAKGLIEENLQRLANMSNRFTDHEIDAIDRELARLIGLLPPDSELFKDTLNASLAENQLGFFDWDSWEPEQVWAAVGNAMQLASIIKSIGGWTIRKLGKSTAAIKTGVQNAANSADDVARSITLTRAQAKRLDDLAEQEKALLARKNTNLSASDAAKLDDELLSVQQEQRTLLNQLGNPSEEALTVAKANAYRQYDIEQAQAELAELEKRKIYTTNRNGDQILAPGVTRQEANAVEAQKQALRQKIADLGGEAPTPATPATTGTPAGTGSSAVENADSAATGVRNADNASPAATGARNADNATPNSSGQTAASQSADNVASGANTATRNMTKAEKIEAARASDNLGYHGSDANISMDDMIRPSANTSQQLGSTGYGIAKDRSAAESYAIKRLIERQNPNASITMKLNSNGTLVVESDVTLNLSNKTGYVYTTAKNPNVKWTTLTNGYAGAFDAAQMPEAVEILAKESFNLDDLVRQGRVRIIQPTSDAASTGARTAAQSADNVASGANTANRAANTVADVATLKNRASSSFNTYLDNFKSTGKSIGLPYSRLTDEEWDILNRSLADEGIRLRSGTQNGSRYMVFEDIPNHPAAVARQNARAAARTADEFSTITNTAQKNVDNILSGLTKKTDNGISIYSKGGLKEYAADELISQINRLGTHYAAKLNTEGYKGADYIIMTMSKTDADKMGYIYRNNKLITLIDNSRNLSRLNSNMGKTITTIKGNPVTLESFGVRSGRPIAVVKIQDQKIPFYISTGSAGKTDVISGEWEFFGGISENGWFRKGGLKSIQKHYNSPELRQIANALDSKIGDLRDTELVLETAGRKSLSGQGVVATMSDGPYISNSVINETVNKFVTEDTDDLLILGDYLQSLKNFFSNL